MSTWERKQAGEIVDAIRFYAVGVSDSNLRAKLQKIKQQAGEAERQHATSTCSLTALHGELCSFCQGEAIVPCSTSFTHGGCDFLQNALAGSD